MRGSGGRVSLLAGFALVAAVLIAPAATAESVPPRAHAATDLERTWEHIAFQFGPGRLTANQDSLNEHLEFRQAVAYAIDRDSLATTMGITPIDSHLEAYDPSMSGGAWTQYDYNPATATNLINSLCSDLGRDCDANPPRMIFTVREDDPARIALANALKAMLEAVGISVQVRIIPWDEQSAELGSGTYDVAAFAWLDDRSDRSLLRIHDVFAPREGFFFYDWGSFGSSVVNQQTARFTQLHDLMNATSDPAAWILYFQEAEQILADQLVFIPLGYRAGCRGEEITIFGTENSETIVGTQGRDVIHGLGGNDTIKGLGGDDFICGGPGDDTLIGGGGDDDISGGDGDDLLRGLLGNDELYGLDGDDRLQEGPGDGGLYGGDGKDKLWGGIGEDTLLGEDGRDQIRGGRDDDVIAGGDDTDRMWGDSGDDNIFGEGKSDFLYGGIGADFLDGGVGNDRLFGWSGDDTMFGGVGRDQLRGQDGDDYVDGGANYDWCSVETTRINCEGTV